MEEQHREEELPELNLFPLNVVLFPGMPMPLRIFEERYKLMINQCIDNSEVFGIMLIREGPEVGGGAVPHAIGTTARITEVERLEDGRMNLSTTGETRFQLVEPLYDAPYLRGKVRYLSQEVGETQESVQEEARQLFQEFIRGLSALRGGWMRSANAPDDAGVLSYSIAHYLDLPAIAKQRLLEVPLAGERLQYELPLLQGAVQRLREETVKRNPYQGPRLN